MFSIYKSIWFYSQTSWRLMLMCIPYESVFLTTPRHVPGVSSSPMRPVCPARPVLFNS